MGGFNEEVGQERTAVIRRRRMAERPVSYNVPKEFLTVKEVAKLLGVTPLTVRNWDAKGKLPAHRHPLNNYRVYKVSDIENLIKDIESSKGIKKLVQKQKDKPQFKKLKIDIL